LLGEKAFELSMITPNQAEKLAGKKAIAELLEKPIGGFLLASRDDKRPEEVGDFVLEFLDTHELLE